MSRVASRLRLMGRTCAAVAVLAGPVAAACGGDAPDDRPVARAGPVELTVLLQEAQRWEASGTTVDEGDFCPAGFRRLLGILDAATRDRLSRGEFIAMNEARVNPLEQLPVIWVNEHSCADGSGSFVVEEVAVEGAWTIVSGTGAYSALTGSGTAKASHSLDAMPESLVASLDIEIGPGDHPA